MDKGKISEGQLKGRSENSDKRWTIRKEDGVSVFEGGALCVVAAFFPLLRFLVKPQNFVDDFHV